MKTQVLIVGSLVLMLGIAMVPAYGQAVTDRATIPFSFAVLGKTFPAGEYTLIAAPHELKIKDTNEKLVVTAIANEIPKSSVGVTGQIIFHCYTSRCFLAELRSPTQGGRQLLTSKAEAALAREETAKHFAILGERPGK